MGKYIKKSKSSREITIFDASQSSSYIGARTRAKTLALQRLHSPSPPPSPATSGSYLQLRSRRLLKPPSIAVANESRKHELPQRIADSRGRRVSTDSRGTSRLGVFSVAAGSDESVSCRRVSGSVKEAPAVAVEEMVAKKSEEVQENVDSLNIGAREEASFGENLLEFEGRTSWESTPCSLIRKPESIRTPSSSTKASSTTNDRIQLQYSSTDVPTAQEVDDFFHCAESKQQRKFIDKYNYDPITDKPLLGRYQWEKLDD